MPKRRRSRALARKGTSAVAAERRRRPEDAQQRDSRLALAIAHFLPSNLQVPLWKHNRRSAIEGPLSKERRSREARRRRASLLVLYIFVEP